MAISTPNSIACCHCAPTYWSDSARSSPMTSPPSTAPGMFPIPPSTAAVNAYSPF